jgi:hypothetical protein
MADTVITDIRSLPEISELGLNDQNIVQINCQRSLNDDPNSQTSTFVQGTQDFMFSVANNQKWSPSRSFFRARCQLQITDDANANPVVWRQPTMTDGVALAEGFMNNAYSNCYCYAASVDISSLTQFVGQANMVKNRLSRSKPWLDTIGKTHFFAADINERIPLTAADANTGLKLSQSVSTYVDLGYAAAVTVTVAAGPAGTITFSADPTLPATTHLAGLYVAGDRITIGANTYTVASYNVAAKEITISGTAIPLVATAINNAVVGFSRIRTVSDVSLESGFYSYESIFQPPIGIFSSESAMPSGSYRISLMPKSNLVSCVESKGNMPAGKSVRVIVNSLYFYMSVFRTEKSFDSGTYYLSLDEMNIQTKTLATQGQGNYNFTIPASTIGIATFVQPISSGTYVSGQKLIPSSLFKNTTADTQKLQFIQLTYSNTSKPVQNYDSNYEPVVQTTQQYLTQRYIDTAMNSELYSLSCESLEDWLSRGLLNYWSWIRSKDDRSTELQMTQTINLPGGFAEAQNQFCCAIYRNLIQVTVENGFITNIVKLQM